MNLHEQISRIKGIMNLSEDFYAGKSIPKFLETFKEKYGDKTFIWLDTETTGLKVHDNQLTELAGIATDFQFDTKTNGVFHKKIKLDKSQVKDLETTRKIVFPMTRYGEKGGKYYSEDETINEFFDWVDSFENPILVAQNASFDLQYLAERGKRKLKKYNAIDTKKIIELFFIPAIQKLSDQDDEEAKKMLSKLPISSRNKLPSSSMGKIVPSLNLSAEGWHAAIADVKMMIKMFKEIMNYLEKKKDIDIKDYQGKRLNTYRTK